MLEMRTHSNTAYEKTNYKHIVDDLKTIGEFKDGLYLDGELYTDEVPFEGLGLLKDKPKKGKEIDEKFKLIKYHVYDCFYLDELNTPFNERYELLKKITKNMENIKLVKNKTVFNT